MVGVGAHPEASDLVGNERDCSRETALNWPLACFEFLPEELSVSFLFSAPMATTSPKNHIKGSTNLRLRAPRMKSKHIQRLEIANVIASQVTATPGRDSPRHGT